MPLVPVEDLLRTLGPDEELRFTLRDVPLDEVFLRLHEARFTGSMELGRLRSTDVDRVFFREGSVVGVDPLGDLRPGDDVTMEPGERAKRSLFQLYEYPEAPVVIHQGIHRLANFYPTFVDLRPAIAYGLVVRSDTARKRAMAKKAAGLRARLIAPYDEGRNSYGLPPPVLMALRTLSSGGVEFDSTPTLPGLTVETTAGLLLLLHRMSLLSLVDPLERALST